MEKKPRVTFTFQQQKILVTRPTCRLVLKENETKENYANEMQRGIGGLFLFFKKKAGKYGEGRSCKWPIFKSRTRVLQRWADYFIC
jgi:hypothetical protein